MIGIFVGYKLSMAFARHTGIDLNATNQGPHLRILIVGIVLMLGLPIVASRLFTAAAAAILYCLGKISRSEMRRLMLRMTEPMSLMETNEEEV